MLKHSTRWLIGLSIGSSLISTSPGSDAFDLQSRLADRRAIEAIYWAHRIWPSANPGHKPPLAMVLPDSLLRTRVLDELRRGAALARFWGRPVTAEQVQEEMSRMAAGTKAPGVLRDLFRALGDDPGRLAESLARPALEDRLLRSWYANDGRFHQATRLRAETALSRLRGVQDMPGIDGEYLQVDYTLHDGTGPGPDGVVSLAPAHWQQLLTRIEQVLDVSSEPSPATTARLRVGHVSRLQDEGDAYRIYAVLDAGEGHLRVATVSWPKRSFENWWQDVRADLTADSTPLAGRFVLPTITGDCADDTWSSMITDVPYGRKSHTAVWTGSEMIVWGGSSPVGPLNSGYRYHPATDVWVPTAIDGATPAARVAHTAVWTGSEMIVWGGGTFNSIYRALRSGGRYDPLTDSWRNVRDDSTSPAVRVNHAAVWTGREMIIWGGGDGTCNCSYENTGARYDPLSDTWTPTRADATTPEPRAAPTAVWTGSEMIVWGGFKRSLCCAWARMDVETGGRYDPVADTWIRISGGGGRSAHSAVWTGSEMIVWGGIQRSLDAGNNEITNVLDTGARYEPAGNQWTATKRDATTPAARSGHTAIWTGGEMILWGALPAGARYSPGSDTWTPMPADATTPATRAGHTVVWTGSEMIVWGGGGFLNTGGRYDPAQDTWVPTPTNGAFPGGVAPQGTAIWTGSEMILGSGRYDPATDRWAAVSCCGPTGATPVWTGTEMIAWAGGRNVGRYDPTADRWTTITLSDAPAVGQGLSTVWTGTEVIVWGGYVCCTFYNSGGRFNPSTNQWTPTRSDAMTPVGRYVHSAVWTGTEMIVWGGFNDRLPSPPYALNSGGRYDPVTDTWSPTHADSSVPDARYFHAAVWSGNEMIVFGGLGLPLGSPTLSATGWVYTPASDAWRPTRTDITAPEGRWRHATVWTGREMIVWGGSRDSTYAGILGTGGRYDPQADSWAPTRSDATTPLGRDDFTSVWTGSGMIAWGGISTYGTILNTGGIYCASSCALTTYFADADGDGHGDPASPVQSCDQPSGYVASSGDCNDADPAAWAIPSEARDLVLHDPVGLEWAPPELPGSLALVYDLLRSLTPADFLSGAACVASDSTGTTGADPEMPPADGSFFYLVRAANACPGGESVLGTNSEGRPIEGRNCP